MSCGQAKTQAEGRFHVDILASITVTAFYARNFISLRFPQASQRENGLRHKDYMRYRQYCTRRLARVRKHSNYSNNGPGNKRKLLGADLNQMNSDGFVYMPLICAERAWSYAMQLKSDLNQESTRKRVHLINRLKKAAAWSTELVRVCAAKADAHTQLEVRFSRLAV
jgi:signal recognition particle subunit SRP68